jgi:hypothetical protein
VNHVPLRGLIVVGLDGVPHVQSQVAEFLAQGLPGDAQQPGGLVLVAFRALSG